MRNISLSRRHLLASAALALPLGGLAYAEQLLGPLTLQQRQHFVAQRRREAADAVMKTDPVAAETNGDEDRYPDRRASFSKTMPHNELGEVDPDAYREWLWILASGDFTRFERAPRDSEAIERLNNPQAAYSIDLVGIDPAALALTAPPAFASQAMATEMIELYWLALMLDVPFRSYEDHPLARSAVSDLVAAGFGPAAGANLFRGETEGDRRGPFVSQFLWHNIPYGIATIEQRFRFPGRGQHFLTAFPEWLDCQRGAKARTSLRFEATPRYISSYRELVEYVHRDFSFQAFADAALIIPSLSGNRGDAVLSKTNPYRGSSAQFGDITLGNKNLLSLLAQASLLAQKASYYHKWQVHRRARPEVFGARVDVHLSGRKSYDLHPALLECEALARVKQTHGSWLLPQAYPEGCPTHPSYPAAHAVNAGACATVLKAFFDADFVIPEPVQATADGARLDPWRGEPLTLGAEIDKLAANIALARDAAGVHFRSDSIRGLHLGEEVALGLLAETSLTYRERFDGFVLSRFDGTPVRISNGSMHAL
jgi:hypothetical protein